MLLLCVVANISLGCGSAGRVAPEPFPRLAVALDPSVTVTAASLALTSTAMSLSGTPYRAGGDTLQGFDCSGFTRYVFAQHGVVLPRLAQEQYRAGRRIRAEDVAPGDLVFFTTYAPGASHVGIALGGGRFVHAPSERGKVRVEQLSTSYWSHRYIGARRMVD